MPPSSHAIALIPSLLSADMSPGFLASKVLLMLTTSSAVKVSRGCVVTSAKIRLRPSYILRFSPASAFAVLGMRVPDNTRDTAATIIPSVGCPLGCNFCTTSAFFGGKGKSIHFYESGDELFHVMEHMEQIHGRAIVLRHGRELSPEPSTRAMQLLDRMKEDSKSWALYVFSSINAIRKYTMEELVQLGISWIWVGLESPNSAYAKLKNSDTQALIAELRSHGIKMLGSTIVGLEHHTSENIEARHRLRRFALHRFSPVHAVHAGSGHPSIFPDAARGAHAGRRGPGRHSRAVQIQLSLMPRSRATTPNAFSTERFVATSTVTVPACSVSAKHSSRAGQRYHDHPDTRMRRRFANEARKLRTTYNAALWAMEKTAAAVVILRFRREFGTCA